MDENSSAESAYQDKLYFHGVNEDEQFLHVPRFDQPLLPETQFQEDLPPWEVFGEPGNQEKAFSGRFG